MWRTAGFLLLSIVSLSLATCPPGFFDGSFNKCYKFFTENANFLTAEKSCESFGGSLVAIQNAFENSYVFGIIARNSSASSFWIGSNFLMATQWTWINGYNGSYLNFATGQPLDPSIYQCAAGRTSDYMWTKELCSTQKPYMCQIDPNASPVGCNYPTTTISSMTTHLPATTAAPNCGNFQCDSGYIINPNTCNFCYKFYPKDYASGYNADKATCTYDKAILPIVHNQAENDFISLLLRQNQKVKQYNAFLSLYCYDNYPLSCKWNDQSPVDYTNFYDLPLPLELVSVNGTDGFWYSMDQSTALAVICQKPSTPKSAV